VENICSCLNICIPHVCFTARDSLLIDVVMSMATFLVSPLLFFAVFYIIGHKMDLVAEFLSVVVPLFLGSWAGHLIGYFPLQFIHITLYGTTINWSWILWSFWYVFRTALSLEFFGGFTALSIAYITRKRSL
jgi:hypothetical protein